MTTTIVARPTTAVQPDIDDLLADLYCTLDDALAAQRRGRPRTTTDAEMACLVVAQMLLGYHETRIWVRTADRCVGHLFPYIPCRSQYDERLRTLGPVLAEAIRILSRLHPTALDRTLLVDTTPVPCGKSPTTVRHSALAVVAAHGYSPAHARRYWGLKLALAVSLTDGFPVAYELVPANASEQDALRELLSLANMHGRTLVGDKGFYGGELEADVRASGAFLLRPDRIDEVPRLGHHMPFRIRIESANWSLKGRLSLERHGARSLGALCGRIGARILALAAAVWFNATVGNPGRHLSPYAVPSR